MGESNTDRKDHVQSVSEENQITSDVLNLSYKSAFVVS